MASSYRKATYIVKMLSHWEFQKCILIFCSSNHSKVLSFQSWFWVFKPCMEYPKLTQVSKGRSNCKGGFSAMVPWPFRLKFGREIWNYPGRSMLMFGWVPLPPRWGGPKIGVQGCMQPILDWMLQRVWMLRQAWAFQRAGALQWIGALQWVGLCLNAVWQSLMATFQGGHWHRQYI